MYENAFNKIERELRNEEGIANELDYVEQTSWVLFLKYLHDLETERRDRAELDGDDYTPIIEGEFRWDKWAAPKKDGAFDHNAARIGDDLIKFVDQDLFPYLAAFRQSATGPRRSTTRSVKFLPNFATSSAPATSCAMFWKPSTGYRLTLRPNVTNSRSFMKHASVVWATRAATAVNTTRRDRSSAP